MKPYLIFFILSPLLMMIEVYCDVKIPSISARIMNLTLGGGDIGPILQESLRMLLYIVVAVAGGVGASYAATHASVNFCHDLREELFVKIQSFSFNTIDKLSTGSLVTRLTNDITQVGQMVVMSLRMLFRAPGMLIGALVMAYTISPQMSLIFLVLTPILATIVGVVLYKGYQRFAKLQDKVDGLNTTVQEGLVNRRVIKAFTREDFEYDKFQEVNKDLRDTGLMAYRVNILQMPMMTLVVNMATLAVLWFGSQLLGKGELLVGDISAFITYLTQILMSVNMIAQVFLQAARTLVSVRRISEVLDETVDITDAEAAHKDARVTKGAIRFENVSFKYYANSENEVLSHINLTIEAGEKVGIIGSTGSGKTTLVHLLLRLYDVSEGTIYIDDVPIKDYALTNLREGVGIVLQNNLLFSGTVRDNLRWGSEEATEEALQAAATYAAANTFVEALPQGYDTDLNQGGLNLSGGQKQRLCIARALVKASKVLIFDDSTSAVDTKTEREIITHLNGALGDKTQLIIAQRISSVQACDKIIVMENGKIVDCGNHETLCQQSKVYQEIYHSQMTMTGVQAGQLGKEA